MNEHCLCRVMLAGHADSVDQLAWHPLNPDLLTTASGDKTVKVWDAKKNREITSIATKGKFCLLGFCFCQRQNEILWLTMF